MYCHAPCVHLAFLICLLVYCKFSMDIEKTSNKMEVFKVLHVQNIPRLQFCDAHLPSTTLLGSVLF